MISEYDIYSVYYLHGLNYYTLYNIHIFYLLLCAQSLHIVLKFMSGPNPAIRICRITLSPLHYCRNALLTVPRQYVYVSIHVLHHWMSQIIVSPFAASVYYIVNSSQGKNAASIGASRVDDGCRCLCLLVKPINLSDPELASVLLHHCYFCMYVLIVCKHCRHVS